MNEFYQEPQSENTQIVFEQKKPKKAKLRSAVAAILAVIVIGGTAGYGGAYIASQQPGVSKPIDKDTSQVLQIPESTTVPSDEDKVTLATDTLVNNSSKTPYTAEQLYEAVKDTVVGIKLYERSPYSYEEIGSVVGSGVIISTDGYLLTNYHVVTDYTKISVVVNDYDDETKTTDYPATVVGLDKLTDLAVLKIESPTPFRAATIGDSDTLRVGREVCAIGNAMGLSKSMTKGIVSGLNREESGYELSSIQTDAALNMGNSGGPLFDMYGNVVGIVNKKIVYDNLVDNIGFAITINEAKPIINDLLENGQVTTRPALGIEAVALDEYLANYFGFGGLDSGLLVTNVQPGTPAEEAGLGKGDVIIKVNGEYVSVVEDVQSHLKNKQVGDTITVTVLRYDTAGRTREYDLEFALVSALTGE